MKFEFNEKNHAYTLDGKRLYGVTTIIGIVDKPQLIPWAVKEAIEYIKSVATKEKNIFQITAEILEDAKSAWRAKRDKAADIGTLCHYWIEQYAKAKISNGTYLPSYQNEQVEKMVLKFIEWAEAQNVTFLLSEQRIYSAKHWYGGTMDLLIEIDGKKYIADVKTSSGIYATFFIQMAGYHIALQEHNKVEDLAGYTVINIPKEFDAQGNAKIEIQTKHDPSEHQIAFLACLDLFKYMKANTKTPAWVKKAKK